MSLLSRNSFIHKCHKTYQMKTTTRLMRVPFYQGLTYFQPFMFLGRYIPDSLKMHKMLPLEPHYESVKIPLSKPAINPEYHTCLLEYYSFDISPAAIYKYSQLRMIMLWQIRKTSFLTVVSSVYRAL